MVYDDDDDNDDAWKLGSNLEIGTSQVAQEEWDGGCGSTIKGRRCGYFVGALWQKGAGTRKHKAMEKVGRGGTVQVVWEGAFWYSSGV